MSADFEEWFEQFRVRGGRSGWQADEVKTWLKAAWNAASPRPWMYGLTADEWLHLAAEGQDSEVAPCCGDISQLREWLNGLATCQGEGESHLFWKPVPDSYSVALGSHDELVSEQSFPLLHRVLAGIRAEQAAWDASIAAYQKTRQENQS